MYEKETFEAITARMLGRASAEMDKREGSILYDMAASVAPELALFYMELDYYDQRTDPERAEGEDLERKVWERGISREPATYALRLGVFADGEGNPFDVPIGSRFSADDVNFITEEKFQDGQFYLRCETAGRIGNDYLGTLFPIAYIEGLATAELKDIIIPGEDAEGDESLRQRYFDSLQTEAFGGNEMDYRRKLHSLPGVGGVKIYRAWQGGGTVRIVFLNTEYAVPSAELVEEIQTAVDPVTNSGIGLGIAPIGHRVTIAPVTGTVIDIQTHITYGAGWSYEMLAPYIEKIIDGYFLEINQKWEESPNVIVRVSHIESRLLDLEGIVDIENTTLNTQPRNLILDADAIAVRGAFHEI